MRELCIVVWYRFLLAINFIIYWTSKHLLLNLNLIRSDEIKQFFLRDFPFVLQELINPEPVVFLFLDSVLRLQDPANLLRSMPLQCRVPIDPSLLTEAMAWQRRETQYGNDAGILHQSLHALADNVDELVQYLPNVARALLNYPAQDEDALYPRLNNRQQRAFRTVQSKIVMFQADDLLS